MSIGFFIVAALSALGLGGLLLWALRGSSQRKSHEHGLKVLESAPQHLRNMRQIRQAMDAADLHFARERGGPALSKRLRSERVTETRPGVYMFQDLFQTQIGSGALASSSCHPSTRVNTSGTNSVRLNCRPRGSIVRSLRQGAPGR